MAAEATRRASIFYRAKSPAPRPWSPAALQVSAGMSPGALTRWASSLGECPTRAGPAPCWDSATGESAGQERQPVGGRRSVVDEVVTCVVVLAGHVAYGGVGQFGALCVRNGGVESAELDEDAPAAGDR